MYSIVQVNVFHICVLESSLIFYGNYHGNSKSLVQKMHVKTCLTFWHIFHCGS